MSEANLGFNKILSNNELGVDLSVLQVKVNKKEQSLYVELGADKLLNEVEQESIKSSLTNRFSGADVTIEFSYPALFPSFMESPEKFSKYIFSSVNKMNESFCLLLSNASLKPADNEKINFTVPQNIINDFIDTDSCIKLINKSIVKMFKNEITIELIESEEILIEKPEDSEEKPIVIQTKKPDKFKSINILGNSTKPKVITQIKELKEDSGTVNIAGKVVRTDIRPLRDGKRAILIFDITDYTSSISVKIFGELKALEKTEKQLTKLIWVSVKGECSYDMYVKELCIRAININTIEPDVRKDNAPEKRIELHAHTKMSNMDGLTDIKELVTRAKDFGHEAIAITDHGVVQAFPEAYDVASKIGIKLILGMEGYLLSDFIIPDLNGEFVAFDLETTGLNPRTDRIIEIGAVKLKNGVIVDSFQTFVDPGMSIPPFITNLTHIDDAMVMGAPSIETALPEFHKFCDSAVLVAHNASFDASFILQKGSALGISFSNNVLDTLELSRTALPNIRSHKLDRLADYFSINMGSHHRADDDAATCANIMLECFKIVSLSEIKAYPANKIASTEKNSSHTSHIILLAKNQKGLENLYKLVSQSHLNYFSKKPQIPKSLLIKHREGLILGSACESGELYQSIVNGADRKTIRSIAQFYDFLEIQPLDNNAFLVRNGIVDSFETLKKYNRLIVELGQELNKPVVATGDVHFLDPQDEYYRRIIMTGLGFSDADEQAPLYLKTTEEMLEDFAYLDEEKAKEVVIDNPKLICEEIESMRPFPNETYPPSIEGSEDEIKTKSLSKAHAVYGELLPEPVQKRLDKELNSIINNGFAVLYLIAHKLVKKSLDDGYLVGSRGSVGSSFVAWLTDITEVNPLPPHYVCVECSHSDFDIDTSKYPCGPDLPDKLCPYCNKPMKKLGYDIPFETFLGFNGDKVPDIDLNFSGEYQSKAHKYVEELFGKDHVFRAGTISTLADKTAYGFVKKYMEQHGISITNVEINRLVRGCVGVKRTTGQHPGGMVIVPQNIDVHLFTPVQKPADDKTTDTVTTHFDFDSLHDRLTKLDILGHDDPTTLRMLHDITGLDPRTIPLDDEETMSIFSGIDALKIEDTEAYGNDIGSIAIPEFGTSFVRQMLHDTMPTTMAELIRISGLSHGTDVWLNNAQDLILNKTATLNEVICTRDDIMNYLIVQGVKPLESFKIMENVRKGKGLKEDMEKAMIEANVPSWFIESCKKIKYMFPKAHAAAYVMMAFRIAYYKVHIPKAFYATYFTVKGDDFDALTMSGNVRELKAEFKACEKEKGMMSAKDKGKQTLLEAAIEMNLRGIKFLPVDLYKSHPTKFLIEQEGIRMPLKAIPGLGETAALSILTAREQSEFLSIEDFLNKTKVSSTITEVLKSMGCLNDLPDTNQLTFFGMI